MSNSRRNFLRKYFLAGTALLGGGVIFTSCNTKKSGEDKSGEIASCSDLSNVSEAEIAKRKSFGYMEESPIPDNTCGNCSLYVPPSEGEKCGKCMLFKGPVYAGAYCTYWAPQT